LLLRWSAIVGPRNRCLLFPYALDQKRKCLRVAVPNGMVKAQYSPLLPLIIQKIGEVLPIVSVETIVLSVEPRFFEKRFRATQKKEEGTPINEDALERACQRLLDEGVSPRFVSSLAKIEVLLNQRRHAHR